MKRFREFFEELKVSKRNGKVYKNPTNDEMKQIPTSARGIVLADGTFLVSGNTGSKSFHGILKLAASDEEVDFMDFSTYSKIEGNDDTFKKYAVEVQRVNKTNFWALGEAVFIAFMGARLKVEGGEEMVIKNIKKHFRAAKKLNPRVKFIMKDVTKFDE